MSHDAEIHALRSLVGHLLWMAAKTDRPHLEEMLVQVKNTAAVDLRAMDDAARRILPASCQIQRQMIENALGIDPDYAS